MRSPLRIATFVPDRVRSLAATRGLFSPGQIEMAITELLPVDSKKGVACFGDAPSGKESLAFTERGFSVAGCTAEQLGDPIFLAGRAAVVFTQTADKPLQFASCFEGHAKRLLDRGCHVFVRSASLPLPERSIIVNIVDRLRLPSLGLTESERSKLGKWNSKAGAEAGNDRPPHVRVLGGGAMCGYRN